MKNNNKLKIVFFGAPSFVIPVLQVLSENFNVIGVVTAPDKKVGRKQILTPSPVKKWALEHQIPVFTPEKLDQKFNSQLSIINSQLFVVAAYGKIIPQSLLDIPKYEALNIHPSLLPKERGASPLQSTILKGEKVSGLTIIKMDEKMDHGPIVVTKKIRVSKQDTFETLSKKMFEEAALLLRKIIPAFIAGKIKLKEQNHEKATFNKMIKKESGYFDLQNPCLPDGRPLTPEMLERMIRAYYPWPNVWTLWKGKVVKFYPKGIVHPDLIGVQMEGKKKVPLKDFLHGYPDFPIKKIEIRSSK